MDLASLIFRPDLGFLALTSFQSFSRPSLSFGKLLADFPAQAIFFRFPPTPAPPGNIHNRSRLLLTNKIRPRFAAMSFDAFAIPILRRPAMESFARF